MAEGDEEKVENVPSVAKREKHPITDLDQGIVGWEDQQDPMNPKNYPVTRKWFLLALVSMITLISPFASSVFAPAVADADRTFHNTSSILSSLAVTSYLFGYSLLVLSPIVSIIALYIATVYGCLYLLLTTITTAFKDTYNWSIQISGLAYLGLGVGFLAGQLVFGLLSDRAIVRLKAHNKGVVEPEMRLPLCIFFACSVPVSFFWYGWSIQTKTHWIVPIVGLFPFAFGLVGLFATLQTYIIDSYPRYAASGIAAITVSRSLFGALLPLAGPTMYQTLGYGWGNSLLGFITLALLGMPIIFNRFGGSLRENYGSRFSHNVASG
ncbi:hypothetical protein PENARI_c030G05585 [Penicillium arizonense]|uniref:Major facilitator superfamily (MFS) profile domain-containing protein n=1 Tax=Penicillium arizonense TaxID=1835702 RepID=A0A1F5L516_PENAI|nr:hypothetical protein PENARI_c030G05585 [Penicillium arizonense]OGE48313.1 hypothetical protein PENARI_c030G05585 [Penicillium arizonense]